MCLLLGANAQTEIHKLESVPVQKPSIEQEKMLFAPTKEESVMSNYYYSTPKPNRKANYTPVGDVKSAQFAENNMTVDIGFSRIYLFPDSLASKYQIDLDGDTCRKYWTNASTGITFDPYSRSFDIYGDFGLYAGKIDNKDRYFREMDGYDTVFYGYKLNEFEVWVDYRLPNGYNPASPDTLRFYITHFARYDRGATVRDDFVTLVWGDNLFYTLCPKYVYSSPIPEKGVGTVMQPTNKVITVDYILSGDDVVPNIPLGNVARNPLNVEIPNGGYPVPPGHCLSIVAQYIPGFDYSPLVPSVSERTYEFTTDTFFRENDYFVVGNSNNDTIFFDDDILIVTDDTQFYTTDTLVFGNDTVSFENDTFYLKNNIFSLGKDTSYSYFNDTLSIYRFRSDGGSNTFVDEDLRMNSFGIITWDMSSTNRDFLFDSKGCNTSFVETLNNRYKIIETYMDSTCMIRFPMMYNPNYYASAAFYLDLDIGDDTMKWGGVVSITDYSGNLISKIYPNPATSQLTIDLNEEGTAIVTVYNVLGQAVIEETLQGISNKINIAELSSGLYFVKVNQNGRNHTVKISKE